MVRGKFTVTKIAEMSWSKTAREVTLSAVTDSSSEENTKFTKFTPSGSISMVVDNPPALEQLQIGKTYYVDFTPAE